MHRRLLTLAALPLLAGYGVAEGLWTDRWQLSHEAEQAPARLGRVPLAVGDWQAEALEMDPREAARAEISGYLMRRYVHRTTGASVTALLVCGPPGRVAVHTPDVCYAGAGYRLKGEPARQAVEANAAGPALFWVARFAKPHAVVPEDLRIRWSWSATGAWAAPDYPRFHFAGSRVLYKLYVIEPVEGTEEASDKAPGVQFLREFLPQLQGCLFPPPGAG